MNAHYSLRSFLVALLLVVPISGCKPSGGAASSDSGAGATPPKSTRKKIAYVTNGVDPFWNTATAGVRAAEKELGIDCEVLMPPKGIIDQKRMVEGLLARGIDGIAISPIDAKNQVDLINQIAERCPVITHDSDAPDSKRLCFIGMNNYKAGRAAGRLVKEAIPHGGKVMLFVGRLEQLNAQQRRQGVIDEVLSRPEPASGNPVYDPPGKSLSEGSYTIVDTRTDNFDYARAKANAQDALASVPDLACMVGLFAYNAPQCIEAAREAGKLGAVQIVSFDEANAVLQGIVDGKVYGTISQQPYQYGYQSVRVLKGLAEGDKSVLPPGGYLEVATVEVRRATVEKFWTELKQLQAAGQ